MELYELNLRGNARTSGDRHRSEGDNAFGQGSRTPVAITILVRNPGEEHHGCRILYRDIGDYLNRDDKLAMLRDWSSIADVADWEEIEPDRHHDWIGKRDEAFRERFANDLAKDLPRTPFALEFLAFAESGRRLAELHLAYETCPEYPRGAEFIQPGEPQPEHYRIGDRAMRFADDDRTALTVNDHVRIVDIPPAAHEYQANGRTPLVWFIDRYRIVRDRQSGIVNDPRDLIAAFRRIVHVSVETSRIVANLPSPFRDSEREPAGAHR